jgi:hypothetical protein
MNTGIFGPALRGKTQHASHLAASLKAQGMKCVILKSREEIRSYVQRLPHPHKSSGSFSEDTTPPSRSQMDSDSQTPGK